MVKKYVLQILGAIFAVMLAGVGYSVSAERYTSPSYTIDASVVGNSFGGNANSASYQLTSSGGESVIGQGSGGSYKLDAGYVSQLTATSNSFSLRVQPSGLIGYYSFDTAKTGDMTVANDAGISSRPLNAPSGVVTPQAGKLNNAAVFDGTNTYYDDKYNTESEGYYVIPPGQGRTFEGWFKTSASGITMPLIWNEHACVGWVIRINSQNFLQALFAGGTDCNDTVVYSDTTSTNTVNDGAWHHFAAVYDRSGGVLKLYLDGTLTDTSTNLETTKAMPVWQQLRIGANWDNSQKFNGQIDEFKFFNRNLDDAEIKAEYTAQNSGIPSGLSLGTIAPSSPRTTLFDSIVQTSANGYSLAIHQNNNLTSGSHTIPAISPTIASPASWTDGTTKGLGFTLTTTNATALDGKWNNGSAYAALPTATASTIYTRIGIPTTKDIITARLRADVASSQPVGEYSNVVTVTGTYTP